MAGSETEPMQLSYGFFPVLLALFPISVRLPALVYGATPIPNYTLL